MGNRTVPIIATGMVNAGDWSRKSSTRSSPIRAALSCKGVRRVYTFYRRVINAQ